MYTLYECLLYVILNEVFHYDTVAYVLEALVKLREEKGYSCSNCLRFFFCIEDTTARIEKYCTKG